MNKNKPSVLKNPKIIMTSAVGYYPSNDFEKIYDESYITKPYNDITDFTHAIEDLQEDKQSDVSKVIIRSGIVLGNSKKSTTHLFR